MKARTKHDAIDELSSLVAAREPKLGKDSIVKSVLDRERECTTAIGRGCAFPHATMPGLERMIVALGISETGIDFDSLDGAPVNFIVLILTAATASVEYLRTLAAFASLSRDPEKVAVILRAKSPADVLGAINSLGITVES